MYKPCYHVSADTSSFTVDLLGLRLVMGVGRARLGIENHSGPDILSWFVNSKRRQIYVSLSPAPLPHLAACRANLPVFIGFIQTVALSVSVLRDEIVGTPLNTQSIRGVSCTFCN